MYINVLLEVSPQHDDVIKWKHFPRYWSFVRGIHRSAVNSPHKGQWRGALMFSLICAWLNGWVNNGEAGNLRRNRAHYDVIVMVQSKRKSNRQRDLFRYRDELYKVIGWPISIPWRTWTCVLEMVILPFVRTDAHRSRHAPCMLRYMHSRFVVCCYGLIPGTLAWISNNMHSEVWDEITYPFPNFNGLGTDTQFHLTLYNGCNNLSQLGLIQVKACQLKGPLSLPVSFHWSSGGEPTKVKCNYIWANVIAFVQM